MEQASRNPFMGLFSRFAPAFSRLASRRSEASSRCCPLHRDPSARALRCAVIGCAAIGIFPTAILICLLFLPLHTSAAVDFAPQQEVHAWHDALEWTRHQAVALNTTEPGSGFDDLLPLSRSIGAARIVAMGEATHGTREFFRLKHRLFEYLVEVHGFRLFGLEASFAGCLPIDHYVQTGEGDVRALIKGQGFWTWDTAEVLELVEWMRAYNARHDAPTERVHFYGFDTQDAATPLRLALRALQAFEPDEAERLAQRLKTATKHRYPGVLGDGSMEDYEAVVKAIDELQEGLARHRQALAALEPGYDRLHFAAEVGRYAVLSSRPDDTNPGNSSVVGSPRRNIRDETMAKTVEWVLDHHGEDARIMLWAHDGHVTKYPSASQGPAMMGGFLEERFGDDYLPVGFSFAQGGFQALYWPKPGQDWARRVLNEYRIDRVIPGSVDDLFSQTGKSHFIVDLRPELNSELPDWFTRRQRRRSIGGLFDPDDPDGIRFIDEVVLPEHFELMAFVRNTSRATPL